MSGRFTRTTPIRELATLFHFTETPDLPPRYNVAPTQLVAAVRRKADSSKRELALLHWGLVPGWADDPKIGTQLFNARYESVATKPAFRAAFKSRRCLVLADGYYEWQKQGKEMQPFFICRRDRQPFAFAGLWDRWQAKDDGATLETCTILTTAANVGLRAIHERMPVILTPGVYDRWLDPKTPRAELDGCLNSKEGEQLKAFPVGKWVNDLKHDDPRCLEPR